MPSSLPGHHESAHLTAMGEINPPYTVRKSSLPYTVRKSNLPYTVRKVLDLYNNLLGKVAALYIV